MTGKILRFDTTAHQATESLLPWFVNGTLEGEELALVQRHVNECARCQHEVDRLHELQATYMTSGMEPDLERSFHKVLSRIEASDASRRNPIWLRSFRRLLAKTQSWLLWTITIETTAIVILGGLLFFRGEPDFSYHTLGATHTMQQTADSLAVVFDPHITEAELRRIVRGIGARVVDGPTVTDAYVLELPSDRQATALQMLRTERAVTLAESLQLGSTK